MKKTIILACLFLGVTYWSFAQNALDFDGNDDQVQTIYSGVLASANRTFEAWVNVSSSAPANNLCIVDYGLNAVGSRNTFSVSGTRGLTFISGGTNANIGSTPNAVQANQWTHVAFVLDNGTGYLYVNGQQVGTGSLTTVNTPGSGTNLRIGQRVPGGTIPFHGGIDEVRIWDVARTPAELQANMNTEFCGPQPNLQLYLKFNSGMAGGNNMGRTMASDASGNRHIATLSNFALNGIVSNWVSGATLSSGTVNTAVTVAGTVLRADAIGAAYQWLECPAMTPIPGETSQSFTATVNGDYAVIIDQNQCRDTSACYTVSSVGVPEIDFVRDLMLYPNPTDGQFSIRLGEQYQSATITIKDITGRQILSNTLSNSQLMDLEITEPAGIYLLHIQSEGKSTFVRLIKK